MRSATILPRSTRLGEPVVVVRDLTKSYPPRRSWREVLRQPRARYTVHSLDGVTCEVRSGEFFGLLGPNGAGKTTFLKILATLILPDAGCVSIGGHDVVASAPQVRRLVAPVIANERSLYWRLSARENLELFAALSNIPARETGARIDEVLDVVALADTGRKMVGQMSSGMMQRLLIARALLARPRVLLLDEPTRSLDPISAREFRRFLREELAERRGCAVVLATHSADEAFDLCDRVGVLHRGRMLAVGETDQLAREFAGSLFRLWTREPQRPALRTVLDGIPGVRAGGATPGADGWWQLELQIDGALDGAARVIQALVASGVTFGALERAPVSLADLIERVVAQRAGRSA